ncbi:hypothetical protein SDC9_195714 [bioreactor metagenome]|uniref:Uncharacterized protein n=1 Tax=bioreactor metagenome TaxID=1076179 RepID=A0A645IAG6_9ZZZZ
MLRSCHQHRLAVGNHLAYGQRLIAGTGRAVDHQIVQISPHHIGKQLFYQADFGRAAPDHRVVRIV